jgi:hypothetical protein
LGQARPRFSPGEREKAVIREVAHETYVTTGASFKCRMNVL